MPVHSGLDVIAASQAAGLPSGQAGVLCHAASVTADLRHILQVLGECDHVTVARVFAPEHGLWAHAQDQIAVEDEGRDPFSHAEIVSLYGASADTLHPAPETLDGLDYIVADLQDVGARYYTFAATAAYLFAAAARRGIPFYLLDRPNPLGGEALEGPPLLEGFDSFVGAIPHLPMRHGMTVAELLRYFAAVHNIDTAALHIIEMQGWNRAMFYGDTGLPWVLPSPNMPTVDTALVYPGGCLLEGTTMSEGRGLTRPFELFGAEGLDPLEVLKTVEPEALQGCTLRPVWFEPKFHKHAHRVCGGFQVHITDVQRFSSVACYIALMQAVRAHNEDLCRWHNDTYEFVDSIPAIDLLMGSDRWRELIEQGMPLAQQQEQWQAHESGKLFAHLREQARIY